MTMKPKILVVDDEPAMLKLVRITLETEDYLVLEASSGTEGLRLAATARPEVVVLDLGLPDMDGIEVIRRLREWTKIPILVLSVRDLDRDKVAALDCGADDYLTKPFSASELLARIRVALRHAILSDDQPILKTGALEIDLQARIVRLHGKEVRLTATEYSLLRLLFRHVGKVVTHAQILKEVWGPTAVEQRQYLRVYFGQLRKKLKTSTRDPELILTEPGIGYRLRLIE